MSEENTISTVVNLTSDRWADLQLYLKEHPGQDMSEVINNAIAVFCEPSSPFAQQQEAA